MMYIRIQQQQQQQNVSLKKTHEIEKWVNTEQVIRHKN